MKLNIGRKEMEEGEGNMKNLLIYLFENKESFNFSNEVMEAAKKLFGAVMRM